MPATGLLHLESMFVAALLALTDRFIPSEYIADPDLRRRGRLLVYTSLALVVVSAYFAVQMSVLGTYPAASVYTMYLGVFFGLFNLVLLRILRSVPIVGFFLCVQVLATVCFQSVSDQGLADPTLLWNLVLPWLAAFLIGPRWGMFFSLLVVIETVTLFMLEMMGFPFPDYSGQEEVWLFYVTSASSVALFIGFVGWLYEGQTLKTLRDSNQALQAARDDLEVSQKSVQSILESITDGFFALDGSLHFTYVNHRAEELIGKKRAELVGEPVAQHLSTCLGMELLELLQNAVLRSVPIESEVYCVSRERWYEVHIYPFAGGLSTYLGDITERKEYEERLIEARDKAEDLARLKSAFLTNISHEIRTPLTGILGFASLLAKETTGIHQEFSELIEANGHRLLETLNSVLSLAKLESGKLQPDPVRVDVADEADRTVQLLSPLADERNLYLNVVRDVDDASVLADPGYVRQILNNLVGNAIKFCDEGGVTISVGGDDEQLLLRVSDTGIGISPAFLPHLFEEFRQESDGLDRSHQGTGLGLAITRRLVSAVGGTIAVESEKGVGTTFLVSIPRSPQLVEA